VILGIKFEWIGTSHPGVDQMLDEAFPNATSGIVYFWQDRIYTKTPEGPWLEPDIYLYDEDA
jgi:hypothetical protein